MVGGGGASMRSGSLNWPLAFIVGVAILVIYALFTVVSVSYFPGELTSLGNWLSDLGNSRLNPSGAVVVGEMEEELQDDRF